MRVVFEFIPVAYPLPDVTQHVIKSKRVRSFLANRMRRAAGVVLVPGDQLQRSVARRGVAAARGVLPLRLCRQAVQVTVFVVLAEGLAELARVFPADALDRQLRPLKVTWIGLGNRLILLLRHLVLADLKGF